MIRKIGRIMLIVVVFLFGFGLIADNWAQDVPSPLMTAKSEKLGTYLVDSKGMTLYIYTKDKEAGKSTCYGKCAKAWPLFVPEADDPPPMAPLSIITRDDGTKQYSYKGKPLYYYRKDTKASVIKGDGAGKVWWVAKP